MTTFRGGVTPLIALVLWLSACQVGQPQAHTSPTPRQSATAPADPQRCQRLAKRGFTPCPPTADKLQLPPTTIKNATNGAVSDAMAREWARAFQVAQAYYYWAMQNNARDALTSGVLADPSPNAVANLFGTDLQDLDAARQASGVLVFQPLAMPITQLVVMPGSLQDAMRRQGLTPKPFGMAVKFVGPATRSIRLPDGQMKLVRSSDAGYSTTGVVWGELKNDSDLGAIWFQYGAYGCEAEVRNVCQL
jgi:hypothetical protein